MRTSRALTVVAVTALAAGVATAPPGSAAPAPVGTSAAAPTTGAASSAEERAPRPRLSVRVLKSGLDIPWDLTFLPGGGMLYTQRDRLAIRYHGPKGADRPVNIVTTGMFHADETGLMSILAVRDFRKSRQFLTCHGAKAPGGHEVRVVLWKLAKNFKRAHRVRQVVKNLPSTSGRHGGCRLRFGPEGALYVGTGDAAQTKNPQSLKSGGGKVLRVQPKTGKPWPGNPFIRADHPMKRKIYTYGHRNVQGLALRPHGGMWSVEHGTYRDDEVNRLRKGGNYGWQPGPGYDESPPMTNYSLPGKQIGARWKSGNPTIAPSGAVWLRGKKWGIWQGCLAMAVLGHTQLRILKFNQKGKFVRGWIPLKGNRLRAAVLGPDHNLYLTTSNGGNDKILKVVPHR